MKTNPRNRFYWKNIFYLKYLFSFEKWFYRRFVTGKLKRIRSNEALPLESLTDTWEAGPASSRPHVNRVPFSMIAVLDLKKMAILVETALRERRLDRLYVQCANVIAMAVHSVVFVRKMQVDQTEPGRVEIRIEARWRR